MRKRLYKAQPLQLYTFKMYYIINKLETCCSQLIIQQEALKCASVEVKCVNIPMDSQQKL